MKAMENLVKFFVDKRRNGKAGRKTCGNHYVVVKQDGSAEFTYHWTVIASVDKDGKAIVTNGGWGTVSTTRACNSYVQELSYRGFDVTRK